MKALRYAAMAALLAAAVPAGLDAAGAQSDAITDAVLRVAAQGRSSGQGGGPGPATGGGAAVVADAAVTRIATARLRSEPLSPVAILLSAPGGTGLSDPARLALAERISRRSELVEMQLASLEAGRGRVGHAVVHLDRAMVVDPDLVDRIGAQLAPLLADPAARSALVTYSDRQWFWTLAEAADQQPDLAVELAAMFAEALDRRRPLPAERLAGIVRMMLEGGRPDDADRVALTSGAATRADLNRFAPVRGNADPRLGPLGWSLENDEIAVVTLTDRGNWEATIQPGRMAQLMTRTLTLAPGSYRLTFGYGPADGGATLLARIRCFRNDVDMASEGASRDVAGGALHEMEFTVPQDCESQTLSIRASAIDANGPVSVKGTGLFTLDRL